MTPKLTAAGKNLLLRALAGESIVFTKMQIGNGTEQDPVDATGLVNPIITAEIAKIVTGTEYVTLTAQFTNAAITSGFRVTEAGFFAKDPDDGAQEILYAIGNEDESSADFVPGKDSRLLEMQLDALIFIGDAENVSAAISSSLVYASKDDFDKHTDNKSNPHKVTKQQIGLGNVPNLAPSDMTITFTDTAVFSNIQSGEKTSTLFGKIKLAISKLMGHLSNTDNPHKVTVAQIGAAAKAHTHNAQDINAGILPLLRGGTGADNAEEACANLKVAKDVLIKASATIANDTELDSAIATWYGAMENSSVNFYRINTSSAAQGIGSGSHFLQICRFSAEYGVVYTYSYQRKEKRRVLWDSKWGEWESEHPENIVNIEYATTERYNGKTVYTKRLHLDQPLGDDAILPGINSDTAKIIRYTATTDTYTLPFAVTNTNSHMYLEVPSGGGAMTFRCGNPIIASNLDIQIWYTKT